MPRQRYTASARRTRERERERGERYVDAPVALTYGGVLTWSDGALVVGHQVDPIDRAEQLFIEHLLLLPGMKRQGDEFVSLLHLFFGLHEELGKGNRE